MKTKTARSKTMTAVANTGVKKDWRHLSLLLPITISARQRIDVEESVLGAETQSNIAKLITEALELSGAVGGISTQVCDGFFRLEELNEARDLATVSEAEKIMREGRHSPADMAVIDEALRICKAKMNGEVRHH